MRVYPIDETFSLTIGGGRPEQGEPMCIHLNGEDDFINLCLEDVDPFIRSYQATRDGAELLSDQEVAWFNNTWTPLFRINRETSFRSIPEGAS